MLPPKLAQMMINISRKNLEENTFLSSSDLKLKNSKSSSDFSSDLKIYDPFC